MDGKDGAGKKLRWEVLRIIGGVSGVSVGVDAEAVPGRRRRGGMVGDVLPEAQSSRHLSISLPKRCKGVREVQFKDITGSPVIE